MKELKRPIYKELPPTRMYLDNVQAIYNILKNNCSSVTIETDKYEISDVAQLKDAGVSEIHTMRIKGDNPYISIDLLPDRSSIYISEDSTINRGILSQIEDILETCERKAAHIIGNFYFPLLLGLLFVGLIGVITKFTEGWLTISIISSAVILYILAFVNSFRLSEHQHSTIVLSERREGTNFLKRNKDQIIVGIIVATVSVTLTILAFKLLQ